jgi:hypothetical protein
MHRKFLEKEIEVLSEGTQTDFGHIGLKEFVTHNLDFKLVTESKHTRGLKWKDTRS